MDNKRNKFSSIKSLEEKEDGYKKMQYNNMTEEELRRKIHKETTEKQQPLYITLELDDMLVDICREKGMYKKDLLRQYVEDGIRRDHKKIRT